MLFSLIGSGNYLNLHPFNFLCNPILFATCSSSFSKLCKRAYTMACGRVLSSAPL
jgi:hypothetical protein